MKEFDTQAIEGVAQAFVERRIRCKQADIPETEADSLTVDRRHNVTGRKADKVVTYIIPDGYVAENFAWSSEPRGSAGGDVRWESDDPHDGQIRLHAWADAYSYSNVKVWDVFATKL